MLLFHVRCFHWYKVNLVNLVNLEVNLAPDIKGVCPQSAKLLSLSLCLHCLTLTHNDLLH